MRSLTATTAHPESLHNSGTGFRGSHVRHGPHRRGVHRTEAPGRLRCPIAVGAQRDFAPGRGFRSRTCSTSACLGCLTNAFAYQWRLGRLRLVAAVPFPISSQRTGLGSAQVSGNEPQVGHRHTTRPVQFSCRMKL